MKRLLPIRKVAAGVVAAAIYGGAHRLGWAFKDDDANQAAQGIVGFVCAWVVPDPRVQATVTKLGLRAKWRLLNQLLEQQTTPAPPAE